MNALAVALAGKPENLEVSAAIARHDFLLPVHSIMMDALALRLA